MKKEQRNIEGDLNRGTSNKEQMNDQVRHCEERSNLWPELPECNIIEEKGTEEK